MKVPHEHASQAVESATELTEPIRHGKHTCELLYGMYLPGSHAIQPAAPASAKTQ